MPNLSVNFSGDEIYEKRYAKGFKLLPRRAGLWNGVLPGTTDNDDLSKDYELLT